MRRICAFVLLCGGLGAAGSLLAQAPIRIGRAVCVPYNPGTLQIAEIGNSGTWRLQRDDGAIFFQFADREDAEAGLAVAKAHTQLCYIGKSNTRANRLDYIMTYWK